MTKEESKMMQGVAILIMIFYHLFNPHDASQYTGSVLGRAAMAHNPVPFFVLLSGYGLYKQRLNGGASKSKLSRCLSLYLRYWMVLTIFLIISSCMGDNRCDLSFISVDDNYLGFISTFYLPSWFILPYCLLVVACTYIFKIIDRLGFVWTFLLSYSIYVVTAYLTKYTLFQGNAFQVFYIFFPFCLGALMAKVDFVEKADLFFKRYPAPLLLCLLMVAFFLRCLVYSGAVLSFYAALFISLLVILLRRSRKTMYILTYLGKASCFMWMIHAWICWYLFRDVVYGLDNPLLIFAFVTLVSYVLAIVFNYLLSTVNYLFRLIYHV